MDTYIVLDCETTGLSAVSNEIIEIGAWKIENNIATSKFSTLIKPRGYLSLEIQKLTGITSAMVVNAPEVENILPAFYKYCGELPLLGYNLSFDYDFVCAKLKPMGYDFTLNNKRKGIDAMALCRKYTSSQRYQLEMMMKHFNMSIKSEELDFHRAEYDAYATKLIYDRFLFGGKAIPDIVEPQYLKSGLRGKAENTGTLSFT